MYLRYFVKGVEASTPVRLQHLDTSIDVQNMIMFRISKKPCEIAMLVCSRIVFTLVSAHAAYASTNALSVASEQSYIGMHL